MSFKDVVDLSVDPGALGICTPVLRPEPFVCSPDELHAIISAAGLAGFRQASMWYMHYVLAKSGGLSDADLLQWLDEAEVRMRVIDAATAWFDGDGDALAAEAEPLIALATLVGATHIMAVTMNEGPADRAKARDGLRALAARAADAGLSVAVEWLPWSSLPTLSSAWELVQSVDRPNVGIVFDNWHWLRQPGGPSPDVLKTVPGDRIHIWQMDDAPAEGDGPFLDETMNRRLLPGEGATDWDMLATLFSAIGAHPIIAPEPLNPSRAAQGPVVYAHAIAEATRRVLSR